MAGDAFLFLPKKSGNALETIWTKGERYCGKTKGEDGIALLCDSGDGGGPGSIGGGLDPGIMEEVRHKKPYYKDSIRGYLYAFVVELLRLSDDEERIVGGRSSDAVLAGALDYVSRHYHHEIKVSSLAEACNMSESHFRRVFEEGMNMKPLDYINLIRVQSACELLKKTGKSMEEVGEESGFASISAFNRNFRKILNVSPYQWKKSKENYEGKLLHCKISAEKGWE